MSSALYDSIARIARHEAQSTAVCGIGQVTDAFPNNGSGPPDYAISVKMRDTQMVLPRVPIAVGALGVAAIPAVDDVVVVVFVNGDYNAPIVVGRLYHADEQPPTHSAGQIVLALPPDQATPDLNLIVDGGAPSAELTLPGGVDLKAEDSKLTLTVGQLSVTLDASGSGQVQLAANSSTVTINQDGDIVINAAGDLKLQGTNIDIEASGQVTIQGATVGVN
jgi:phage baseplate assembly protein gpV